MGSQRRLKVLVSAYACEPGKGSESEVGLRAVLAAASRHRVWVLTRENNLPPLREFLSGHELESRIHLIGIDADGLPLRVKNRLGTVGIQWYYRHWQRLAADKGARLHAKVGFDVTHHSTLASYWAPMGVTDLDVPSVVGPVGGGVGPPLPLLPELGIRGALSDGARIVLRSTLAHLPGALRGLRRARVVLVQNPETLNRIGDLPNARLLSNALSIDPDPPDPISTPRRNEIVSTGRLLALKGNVTAVRVLAELDDPEVRLVLIGDGPQRRRIERLASRLGVADRVDILGWRPRDEVIERVRTAGVYLHTAIHDEASLSVSEALMHGTPVVGYDHGGPAQVMANWPPHMSCTFEAATPQKSARRLAAGCRHFLDHPLPVPAELQPPIHSFRDSLLDAYEKAVA